MIEFIGISGLIILFIIGIPNYYKWSYKRWYLQCEREAILKGNKHDKSTD
jgi:hypothetical protein